MSQLFSGAIHIGVNNRPTKYFVTSAFCWMSLTGLGTSGALFPLALRRKRRQVRGVHQMRAGVRVWYNRVQCRRGTTQYCTLSKRRYRRNTYCWPTVCLLLAYPIAIRHQCINCQFICLLDYRVQTHIAYTVHVLMVHNLFIMHQTME